MTEAAYQLEVADAIAAQGADTAAGLTTIEAQARLAKYGPNELLSAPPVPAWRKFLAQFNNPLVLLLLGATVVSFIVWLIEKDSSLPFEALAILSIVVLNSILGYAQEARAERAVAALKAMAAAHATVLRDGEIKDIPAAEVVPGDILILEEGDTIAADARLIDIVALQTSESALTGESLPVSKSIEAIPGAPEIGDRHNMVFNGSAVTYGRGRGVVTGTGMKTEMGHIANLLSQGREEPTPLQIEIAQVGRVLGIAVIAIAVVMIGAILITQSVRTAGGIVDALILGVSLAVAAVPEGLATIMTVVLALGVQRMAKRNAIIRKLAAVETLGSANIICTDKTGTLTRNEMTVRALVTAGGRVDFGGAGYAPKGEVSHAGRPLAEAPESLRIEAARSLRASMLANNSGLALRDGRWAIQGDPTEAALRVAALKFGLEPNGIEHRFERTGEVPFSSERKLMSTVHADAEQPERVFIFAKGAPDVLLGRCTHERVGEDAVALDAPRRERILASIESLAGEALRTLGVAYRTESRESVPKPPDAGVERDMVFLGLIGMIDPPRTEAAAAIRLAETAGIRVIMITGDHPRTAQAIGTELGLVGAARTGAEINAMDETALRAAVRDVSVFARVSPEHKLRIVRALKANGAVTAMTGDGVNDAPALKTADIGIAMGITGTDVSKEAADMILADDNFATIVAAVEEGRAIFSNIRKFLRYLLSSNIGEVLTMFLGVMLAGVLGIPSAHGELLVLPLLATQLLWINLVTDSAPALALGLDPARAGAMQRPPRAKSAGVLDRRMWTGIVFVGAVMAAGTLLVLDASLPGGLIAGVGTLVHARTMAFTTLVLFQLFNVLNARSDERSAFEDLFVNRWVWAAVGLSLALQALVVYVPFLQQAFQTTALSVEDWLLCLGVGSTVLWAREAVKLVRRVLTRR
ncbi:MAG TPA: cation-translocating P-type ATPase [Thermoflexales bacterium]|nr:cation-translocating P-type ATPase [Thermoflexales bacterium]HQY24386.1 cation-translocating P-type ATPase [Thermoflexales bacterium]